MSSMPVRSPQELLAVDAPAWPRLAGLVESAVVEAVVLSGPADPSACIWALQVSAGSMLGALAAHTGGVMVDHGWLRILGGGGDLPDLASVNGLSAPPAQRDPPPMLVVGYDVLGGCFALNGGGLGGDAGEVNYWGPDTLEWTPIGAGHSSWVEWALSGGLSEFYAGLRWPGWEAESAATKGDEGISIYPPPFTRHGRDLAAASRRTVPFNELLGMNAEYARQLADVPPGAEFSIQIIE